MTRAVIGAAAALWLIVLLVNLTVGPPAHHGKSATIDWGTPAIKWEAKGWADQ